jgi:hypothetical protein
MKRPNLKDLRNFELLQILLDYGFTYEDIYRKIFTEEPEIVRDALIELIKDVDWSNE